MAHRKRVIKLVLVQIQFIQCKQFSVTDGTSHNFQQISDLKIVPECFRRSLTTLWQVTCGPRSAQSWYRPCPFCKNIFIKTVVARLN